MLFEYRYFGSTTASSTPSSSGISFAPDTRRAPTFLSGQLRKKLPFRETISALHAVVVSDLRFRPRDRTDYLAWRAQQDQVDLAELAASQRENAEQIAAIQAELSELRRRQQGRWGAFRAAQKRFFEWLYRKNLDAWFVLDPVITVHPDEVAFECFSQDESSYGRLACSHEVFEQLGPLAYGTTNVDYSASLYDEFQKIRDDKVTSLQVDPAGFEVQSGEDEAYREVKIDLPDSWVRGFLQVTTAMVLPGAVRLQLHPMDVHNLCFVLRRHKERRGPRSLRFLLEPGRPVRVKLEPFDIVLDCPRSTHDSAGSAEVRIWGRRRLLVLERLIPVARSFTAVLVGSGMPSFWVADCGDLTFTLGLSGWTANDWSNTGNFDLLAPRADVDTATSVAAFDALRTRYRATSDELSVATGFDRGTVDSAMVQFTQAGRVVYDLHNGVWRLRELSREPLDLGRLRWANERESAAAQLAASGQVQVRAFSPSEGLVSLEGRAAGRTATLVLDADRRLVSGHCDCRFHFQNRLRKGPCEHLLAVRVAHERGLAASWVDEPPPVVVDPPPPPRPAVSAAASAVVGAVRRLIQRAPRAVNPYDLTEAPNEAAAILRWRSAELLAARMVVQPDQGDDRIRGRIGTVDTWIAVRDGQLLDATCGCVYARQTRLRNGPCEHMYALWFAHGAAEHHGREPASPDVAPPLEPWLPPAESGALTRGDAEGFVRMLEARKLIELDPAFRHDFVRGIDGALSGRAAIDVRARRIWQMLEQNVAVREFYLLDEQDLVALIAEWG